ncbi:hypothetical protein BASA62_000973, partial [Batrachochytrium salamandrivorans]
TQPNNGSTYHPTVTDATANQGRYPVITSIIAITTTTTAICNLHPTLFSHRA